MANLDIVIPLPKPKTKAAPTVTPGSGIPTAPTTKLPKTPASATKAQANAMKFVAKMQKIVGTIQKAVGTVTGATITLKLKRGGNVIFEKKVAPLSNLG